MHGTREVGAKPLLVRELERVVSTLGESTRDARDRALLLLGFAGPFRSSDLVALGVTDIELAENLLRVHLRRSKEDQLGRGSITEIRRAHNPALSAPAVFGFGRRPRPRDRQLGNRTIRAPGGQRQHHRSPCLEPATDRCLFRLRSSLPFASKAGLCDNLLRLRVAGSKSRPKHQATRAATDR